MKMLSEEMINAIKNELVELTNSSNKIKITKFELFDNARKACKEFIKYSDIDNSEIHQLIIDICNENNYSFTIRKAIQSNKKIANEYFIITETMEESAWLSSRNRIYIKKDMVELAGFKPGDKCACIKFIETDGKINYHIVHADTIHHYDDYDSSIILVTVEKNGGIRFTCDQFDNLNSINVSAGLIHLY